MLVSSLPGERDGGGGTTGCHYVYVTPAKRRGGWEVPADAGTLKRIQGPESPTHQEGTASELSLHIQAQGSHWELKPAEGEQLGQQMAQSGSHGWVLYSLTDTLCPLLCLRAGPQHTRGGGLWGLSTEHGTLLLKRWSLDQRGAGLKCTFSGCTPTSASLSAF